MFCLNCGKEADSGDAYCRSCGKSLSAGRAAEKEAEQPTRRLCGEATASLVLGLFSLFPNVFTWSDVTALYASLHNSSFVFSLLAVIFGHMAKASIRRSKGALLGEQMANVGFVLGYLGVALLSLNWLA